MLIGPPVPEIKLFQTLTFKIQGRWHGWGQSSSHNVNLTSYRPTHISFVPCQSALPFLRYSSFKIWPWKSKVKVIAQGHKVGITPYRLISLSFHVDRPSHSWVTTFSKFDRLNQASRSWVQSHNVGVTSYELISLSFHVNRPSHSWDIAFSKLDLENPRSRS